MNQLKRASFVLKGLEKWTIRGAAWLWPVCGFAAVIRTMGYMDALVHPGVPFGLPAYFAEWHFIAFVTIAAVASIACLARWGSATWLTLVAWSAFLLALRLVIDDWGQLSIPWPDFLYAPADKSLLQAVYLMMDVFDEPRIVVLVLFALVLAVHRRAVRGSDEPVAALRIGRPWSPLWAGILALFVAMLLNVVPPYGVSSMFFLDGSFEGGDFFLDGFGTMFDESVSMVALFSVYAWKTGAYIAFGKDRFTVSLADGALVLFSREWTRVQRVHVLSARDKVRTVVFEHGLLPFYRSSFGLRTSRDGDEVVARAVSEASGAGCRIVNSQVRPKSGRLGALLVVLGLASVFLMTGLSAASMVDLAESGDDFVQAFVGRDYYLLFGSLCSGGALLIGLGFGLMFANTHGGIRWIPLMLIAMIGGMLPDPMIYWLVYIAIFAILSARMGYIEVIPAVPIPDSDVAVIGLWLVGAKALFCVGGYVLGVLLVVRPWYRALPSIPYRLRGRAPVTDSISNVQLKSQQDAKIQA